MSDRPRPVPRGGRPARRADRSRAGETVTPAEARVETDEAGRYPVASIVLYHRGRRAGCVYALLAGTLEEAVAECRDRLLLMDRQWMAAEAERLAAGLPTTAPHPDERPGYRSPL